MVISLVFFQVVRDWFTNMFNKESTYIRNTTRRTVFTCVHEQRLTKNETSSTVVMNADCSCRVMLRICVTCPQENDLIDTSLKIPIFYYVVYFFSLTFVLLIYTKESVYRVIKRTI